MVKFLNIYWQIRANEKQRMLLLKFIRQKITRIMSTQKKLQL
jgi:hypothetical protein